ncbi:MAG: hypothetical protein N3G79_05505 [Sulfolobales archaeon]|nr:hypothetical protein [Sulfolobales archaeon]
MRTVLAVATLTVALLLVPLPALAELPRHTPNFPHGVVVRDREVLDLLSKLASLDQNYEQYLEELVERGVIDSSEALRLAHYDTEKLSQLDPELQSELARVLEEEVLIPEELEEIAKKLLELERLGKLDPHSFVVLARVVAEGFRRLNLEVPAQLSASVMRNLLEILYPKPSAAQSAVEVVEIVERSSVPSEFVKLPKQIAFSPPVPQVSVPSSLLYAISLATVSSIALLLVARWRALEKVVAKLVATKISRADVGSSANDAISTYWKSVELVERKLGIKKADHQTHREFLSLVEGIAQSRSGLERAVSCFKEITEIYEISRFSYAENGSTASRRAREMFANLVRSLG